MRAIFCDISKAFDRVWHKGLLYKLQTVGITGHLLQWFTDYFNNRKQRLVLPGVFSDWTDLKASVPQGSILGPLLFLIYINDIVRNINSFIRTFADDTSLYIKVENPISNYIKLWPFTNIHMGIKLACYLKSIKDRVSTILKKALSTTSSNPLHVSARHHHC